ncbi:MAG: flavodoxin family protein [Armatimonadetes bacterium]|nr:flavodoxin family protein [Armatimonadota bacterium]NIO75126.1 flavodoxin family protein [Armatimonadota bacterium]NIO95750.1 flavodoxin family protein [Armatimonadota bacterium]
MTVLGLMGSPKAKGNADLLLDRALAGAESAGAETEKLVAAKLNMAPCIACRGCEAAGECVVRDGMTEVYPKLENADAIIVATPIHFMGMPAQLKALVDRCQPFWVRKYRFSRPIEKRRKGLFIAVGGTNLPHTFDAIELEIKSFFHCLNVEYTDEILIPEISEHGDIADREAALMSAYRAGERLARTVLEEAG